MDERRSNTPARVLRPGSAAAGGGSLRDGTPVKARRATMERARLALGRDLPVVPPPPPGPPSQSLGASRGGSGRMSLDPTAGRSGLGSSRGGAIGASPPRLSLSPRAGYGERSAPFVGGKSPRQHIRRSSSGIVPSGLHVGARVFLPATRCYGIVKYFGPTHFASEMWVGVELDSPKGKNGGDVQGRRYFECRPMYGLFVRPGSCTILEGDEPSVSKLPSQRIEAGSRQQQQERPFMVADGGGGNDFAPRSMGSYSDVQKHDGASPFPKPSSVGVATELHTSLLDEKWLVDMLVEMVSNSDMMRDKISEVVKDEVARNRKDKAVDRTIVTEEAAVVVSTALERGSPFRRDIMSEIDSRVATGQRESHDRVFRELELLKKDVHNHLRNLEEQVLEVANRPPVVVAAGGGPSTETVEDYTNALRSIGEAAKAARSHVLADVEQRIQRLSELSALAEQRES